MGRHRDRDPVMEEDPVAPMRVRYLAAGIDEDGLRRVMVVGKGLELFIERTATELRLRVRRMEDGILTRQQWRERLGKGVPVYEGARDMDGIARLLTAIDRQ